MSIAKEVRLIYDHYRFRINKRRKKTTIHTEVIYSDKIWKEVKDYVNKGKKAIWYVMTPVNIDFTRATFGYSGTDKQFERLLISRYKWLQEREQEIQLHVHLHVALPLLDEKESWKVQEDKIKKSLEWMKKNGFDVDKIVFGWWSYDKISMKLAKKYGLEVIHPYDYFYFHDYELILPGKWTDK